MNWWEYLVLVSQLGVKKLAFDLSWKSVNGRHCGGASEYEYLVRYR